MTRNVTAKPQSPAPPEEGPEPPPFATEVKEFIRNLLIADKTYQLYPLQGKVVQQSLAALYNSLRKFFQEAGQPLQLEIAQFDLLYEEETVYHEENRAKSLAYLMYKDSVRQIVFLKDIEIRELSDLLSCFKHARLSDREDEDEEDFSTLFWEKDFTNIQIEVISDFFDENDEGDFPDFTPVQDGLDLERFSLTQEEEQGLLKKVENLQPKDPRGDSAFDLSEEELKRIQQFKLEEVNYSPYLDFVDILIEVMARKDDPKAFGQAMQLIRRITFSLIQQLDIEHAVLLLKRLSHGRIQALPDGHRYQIQEMLRSFCDKPIIAIIADYLKENAHLSKVHPIFQLMKALPRDAVPHFCELLKISQHTSAVTEVLIELGAGFRDVFSHYLMDPDPLVACAVIRVLATTSKGSSAEAVAPALKHPLEAVRLQAALSMLEAGDARVGPYFVSLLKDPAKALVYAALKFFNKVPFTPALKCLLSLINSRRFYDLDAVRQEQCFRAVVLADPQSSIKFISRSLFGWSLCFGNRALQRKTAALRSLRLVPCSEALQILKKIASRRRTRLSRTAQTLLKEMEALPMGAAEPAKEPQHA